MSRVSRVTRVVRGRTPGWWLRTTGTAHLAMGAVIYRDVLGEIRREGPVNSVPDRGDRAAAFWFLAAGTGLVMGGQLLRSAERNGDRAAQRTAGAMLVGIGAAGIAAMPRSGFWALPAIGAGAVRRGLSRRTPAA